MLGTEPVGISCPCGQSRALDQGSIEDGEGDLWVADVGRVVSVKSGSSGRLRAVVRSMNMTSRFHEGTEIEISLQTF